MVSELKSNSTMGDKDDNQKKEIQMLSYNDPQLAYYLNSSDHPGYIINIVLMATITGIGLA